MTDDTGQSDSSCSPSRTQRTRTRESSLGFRVAQGCLVSAEPLMVTKLLVGATESREAPSTDNLEVRQLFKRRRLMGRQPPPTVRNLDGLIEAGDWEMFFRDHNSRVPRVGGVYFQGDDEVVKRVQALIPQFEVKHVVLCRGANRVRPPQDGWEGVDIPLRNTVVVKRDGGRVVEDGDVEEWTKIPRYKRNRAIIPARVSLTAYGAMHRSQLGEDVQSESLPRVERAANSVPDDAAIPEDRESESSVGFPPRAIPRHGPGFLSLREEEKRSLTRLHNNLGHPAAEVLVKFLVERKAEPRIIQAARDYACSACIETVAQPKVSRPSHIHRDGDFGDTLGMDVAYWTNQAGQKFLFTHIIDEATLFHQAIAIGRTPEEQFAALTDQWFRWAGPCQLLYIDPAGEYTSEFWREQLQREGIHTKVSAGEAHWQLGRVEAHGSILKAMLTRMDSEDPIRTEAEFRRCLRQATNAKNSLSRVRGFTPEQAVVGKMSRLPASIVSDDAATSHAVAASELPEGIAFRRSLERREQARSAFVRTDNDNAYRRALLRRSRPMCQSFEAGDWVLYWRRQKGGARSERGRWYGPGQVICSDGKVVWISHCGYLIRAAPEQIRSASMREWKGIQKQGVTGNPGMMEHPPTRRVYDLAAEGSLPTR